MSIQKASVSLPSRRQPGRGHGTNASSSANRLITVLPCKDRQNLLAACETVHLRFGQVLCEPNEDMRHVYFPIESFISLVSVLDGRTRLEVGLIGSEGMLGVPLVLGVPVSPLRALVQGPGAALRISAEAFREQLDGSAVLRDELKRYIYVLMEQLALTGPCLRFHLLGARLARWLLMTNDRAHSDEFRLTHELLAQMLGVRRVGVTNAAGELQKQKLITYTRGEIRVIDRAGLESASCNCYQAARDTYEGIFGRH